MTQKKTVVVQSQAALEAALTAARVDSTIARIEIRSDHELSIVATGGPVDRGLHDVVTVGPEIIVAGNSQLSLDDGVAARIFAIDKAWVGVTAELPLTSPLRGTPRLDVSLSGEARACTAVRLNWCQLGEKATLELTASARGTAVSADGEATVIAPDGVEVDASGQATVRALGATVHCRDSAVVEATHNARVTASGNSMVRAAHQSQVEATERARVVARGAARVVAHDDARVIALEHAEITANDRAVVVAPTKGHEETFASIAARGESQVEASDLARVLATDHARVILRGFARCEAHDLARVDARGSSTVIASGEANVTLRNHSRGSVCGRAHVRALNESSVDAAGETRVHATDNASVRAQGNVEVTATGRARVEAGDHVRVFVTDEVSVVATHYAVVTPRVHGPDGLLPATSAAAQERPPQVKVELHDFASVVSPPPSVEVTRTVGLPELDLAGLGMAQLVAGLGHEQSLER